MRRGPRGRDDARRDISPAACCLQLEIRGKKRVGLSVVDLAFALCHFIV